jgi:putative peptide zinc metalloprotease protein
MAAPFTSSSWYRVAELKPKLRPHSQIHRHRYRHQPWYVLQDHATGRVHRFTPAAYLFIGNMDGVKTVDQIWTEIAVQLDEDAPTQDEIIQLLAQLHCADMLQLDSRPDPDELFERLSRQRRSLLRRNVRNPLSMTIPLWDPDRFLDRSIRLIRPILGWTGLGLWAAVVLPAAVAAIIYWGELTQNISDRVLTAQGLVLMGLLFPLVKLVHELAHAYAAKASGGEVHEMGIMLLVFYPIPYVDASSSSSFRSKWRRALVGAAGIGAELFLAAIAMYGWLAMEPSVFRACAYDVMLIAGVSTLIVNGNPLLRFDGYYILSDLVEMPNLAQRSAKYWIYLIERHLLGADVMAPAASPDERKWLLFFAPASFCYRMLVLFAIAIFVASEYFIIGVLIAILAAVSAVVLPIAKGLRYLFASSTLRDWRGRALSIAAASVLFTAMFMLLVPFPLHTSSEGVVWLPENARVRAGTDGFVQKVAAIPGQAVKVGDVLFESDEPLLITQIEIDRRKVQQLELKLASERFADRVKAEVTRNELAQEKANLDRDLDRARRLTARSPAIGILDVPKVDDLPGRFFHEGDVIGYVIPSDGSTVRVIVSQDDIDLVRNWTHRIEAKIPDRLTELYTAQIVREVPAAGEQLPSKALGASGGGKVAADPRDSSGSKTLQRFFQFDLKLDPVPVGAGFGSRVYVRFEHNWEPLGYQLYRRARQLFLARFYV